MGFAETDDGVTDRNDVAVGCLDAAITASRIPRKVLAEDHVGVSEAQFSRLVHSAALELFDKLPDVVVLEWLRRMGEQRAFEVRALHPVELDAEVVALIDQLSTMLRLRKVRGRSQAKADLRVDAHRRVMPA